MAVKHSTNVGTADDGTSQVGSDEWNAEHNHVPFTYAVMLDGSTVQVYLNLTAADREFAYPKSATKVDLTYATQVRVVANQQAVGVTGKLRLDYSTDQSAWQSLGNGGGPVVTFATVVDQMIASPWVNIATGAKADVWVKAVAYDGNNTED